METIVQYLQANIVLVMFFVIGLGTLVGRLKIAGIELGDTTGILLVGLVVGLMHFTIPGIVKGVSFTLYIFILGVGAGPAFISMITSRAGLKPLAMSLMGGVFMGIIVYVVASYYKMNGVVVGGLSSGAMTTSAILAAGQGLLDSGTYKLPEGMTLESASATMGGVYAITYLWGIFGVIVLLKFLPRLIGKDIAVEAAKLDSAAGDKDELVSVNAGMRAWQVTAADYVGKTVADLEAKAATYEAEHGIPTLVEKVLRNGELLELSPDLVIESGDIVAVWATPGMLILGDKVLGEEVTDPKVLSVKLDSAELVVTNKELVGKTLGEFVREYGRGVTIERMVRTGKELPVEWDTALVAGDVLFASGPQRQVEAFAQQAGYEVKDQLKLDLVNLGLFAALFGVLGTITVTIGGVKLALLGGAAMGSLVGGVVLGWLRSRSPRWGSVPSSSGDAIVSIGVGLFISCVAIGAGGSLVELLQTLGVQLLIAGFVVTTFCTVALFFFGQYVLRMNVAHTVGATFGTMTGFAINEFVNDAKSNQPLFAFLLPAALNNLIYIIVAMVLMSIF